MSGTLVRRSPPPNSATSDGALVLHSLMPLGKEGRRLHELRHEFHQRTSSFPAFILGYGYFTICVDEYYANLPEFLGRIPCVQPLLTVSLMLPISAFALVC